MSSLQVQSMEVERFDIATRMPFKFGISTMTHLPHLFITLQVSFDGEIVKGVTADHLPPKWFTKNPDGELEEEIEEMLMVIEQACALACDIRASSVFDFWHQLYDAQMGWARSLGIPSLLANFGTSLMERAVIDAFCRWRASSFHQLLLTNAFCVDWSKIHPGLSSQSLDQLAQRPHNSIIVRHTIGLSDPLRERDISTIDRIDDGLPQSLEACLEAYQLSHFKIKVSGQSGDIDRLVAIDKLFREQDLKDFAFSLDGNEQFRSTDDFAAFWEQIQMEEQLGSFFKHLLFVEQPFHRDLALSDEVGRFLRTWAEGPMMIIDESDAEIASLPRALQLGYRGTSHKNCKGVFKGIANRLLLGGLSRASGQPFVMSGEDLTNIGPIANHQDLVVQASLGIRHVERNGHHYFRGLSMFEQGIQDHALKAYPHLYTSTDGLIHLKISEGKVNVEDLVNLPFGTGSLEAG